MSKKIQPAPKSIKEYLIIGENELSFNIPEYQRAYSWDKLQCDKLIQDIENFMDCNGKDPYFFGTIILDRSKNEKDIDQRNLIDGQQRTVSFFLLLKAILLNIDLNIEKSVGDASTELRFELEESKKEILKIIYKIHDDKLLFKILSDNNLIKSFSTPLESHSINESNFEDFGNILCATTYDEAERNVIKIKNKKFDNKYSRFFRNFKFFYERMSEKSPSQLSEFSKSFLNTCQVIEISSWDVEQAIVMFNSLNSTGLPLSDADVLSAQLYSKAKGAEIFKEKRKFFCESVEALDKENIINILDIFTQFMYILRAKENNKEVTMVGVRKFFVDNNRLNKPFEFMDELNKIVKNWENIKDVPLTKLLLKLNYNTKFFIASYIYSHRSDTILDVFENFLKLFIVLEIVDVGYSSRYFKQFLFEENIKLVNETITSSEIVDDFKNHIKANWKKEGIIESVLAYRGNSLVLINEYLYCKEKKKQFTFDDNYNIEHIMPNSGKNLPIIRKDAEIYDENEFYDYVDQLGNKIILEENINKSIGNEWFKTKKLNTVCSKLGYKDSKYSIATAMTSYYKDLWTKEDIESMTKKIANRIADFIFE